MDEKYELTETERKLIDKYLEFYKSLASGKRKPVTEAQHHFVKVCKGNEKAVTTHELAYIKYRMELIASQKAKEISEDGIRENEPGFPNNTWFTEKDWNKLHPDRRHH